MRTIVNLNQAKRRKMEIKISKFISLVLGLSWCGDLTTSPVLGLSWDLNFAISLVLGLSWRQSFLISLVLVLSWGLFKWL